jgi:hypothetical protein
MSARFAEIRPDLGVDENAVPIPQMMVPLNGSNMVCLFEGTNLILKPERPNVIAITEVRDRSKVTEFVTQIATLMFGRGPEYRIFRIAGKRLGGVQGALVCAMRGKTVVARLRAIVLGQKTKKIAVRPLKTDASTFHAKHLPDEKEYLKQINDIWTPQANVRFDLIPSSPAIIDDQGEIASALGVDYDKGVFHDTIDMLKYGPVFRPYVDRNADFTIFVVRAISTYYGSYTRGVTDTSYTFALVDEDATARTWAHELGHFLIKKHWESPDAGTLMVSGGTGEKISVDLTINAFNQLF